MKKLVFSLMFGLLFVSCYSDSDEIPKDITPPSLSISIEGASSITDQVVIVSNQIVVNVDAKDSGGLSKVEAFIDGTKVGEDSDAPYRLIIDVSGYSSKVSSKALEEYILRIDATDKAGNSTSKEVTISIDNNAPSISNVSLKEKSVIGGEVNPVTFEVSDNDGVSSVEIYVNDEILNEVIDDEYGLNLDTSMLEDGENVLKVEAVDAAGNNSVYSVIFIVDNTGPMLSFNNLEDDQIVDKSILIDLVAEDAYSDIAMVTYSIGEEVQYETENDTDFDWEFFPRDFSTGLTEIVVVAKDDLGNEGSARVSIEILRRLIKVNFAQGFYQRDYDQFYVFASNMEGKLLDVQRVLPETESIDFRTAEDFSENEEFMLTLVSYRTSQTFSGSNFSTISNISGLEEINLRAPVREHHLDLVTLPASGFDSNDLYQYRGGGRLSSGDLLNQNTEFRFYRNQDVSRGVTTDKMYVGLHNRTLDTYSYGIFDWDLGGITEIRPDMFTQDGIEIRTVQSEYLDGNETYKDLILLGFLDENEYQNWLWNFYGVATTSYFNENRYIFNKAFYKQKYSLTLDNYHVWGTDDLDDYYPRLNWTLDYDYSNNVFDVYASSGDHIVGKITLTDNTPDGYELDGKRVKYYWEIYFDSQNQTRVALPEIPEELQSWEFFGFYEQKDMDFSQIEIKRYEGLATYNEFLEKVIKVNTPDFLVSPKIESISNSAAGYFKSYINPALFF